MGSYSDFAEDTKACLSSNLTTLKSHSVVSDCFSTTFQELTRKWGQGDPTDEKYQKMREALDKIGDYGGLLDFIHNWMSPSQTAGTNYVNNLSTKDITDVLAKLQQFWGDANDKNPASIQQGIITQVGTLVSSKQTNETAVSDSQTKVIASLIQNDSSAQTAITEANSTVIGILAAFAGILSTVS